MTQRQRRKSTSITGSINHSRGHHPRVSGRVRFWFFLTFLMGWIMLVVSFWTALLQVPVVLWSSPPTPKNKNNNDMSSRTKSRSMVVKGSRSDINLGNDKKHGNADSHKDGTVGKNSSSSSSIVIALRLQLDKNDSIDIQFQLLDQQAPDATRFILSLLEHPENCSTNTSSTCTIYRGEPSPRMVGFVRTTGPIL
jgi:hypothetical protein